MNECDWKTDRAIMFSVIMPTYNRVFCISNAIDSLLAQTYQGFELVIVDDGSTDGTEELLYSKYGRFLVEEKIIFHRQSNQGVCAARNKGLELSKYDWKVYLDSDNTLEPCFLDIYKDAIDAHPDFKIFYSQMKRDTGAIIGQEFDYAILCRCNFIDMGTFVHHKSLCELYGKFDLNLKRLVDWDLVLRYTRFEIPYFINKVLLNYVDGKFARITNTESLPVAYEAVESKIKNAFYPLSDFLKGDDFIEIYFDTGSGFSEWEKSVFSSFPVEVRTRDGLRALRVDPSSKFCIIRNISISTGGRELVWGTNAYFQDGDTLYFDTTDPQIYVELPGHRVESFQFNMQVFRLDEQLACTIKSEHEKSSVQAVTIENLQNQLWQNQRELSSIYASHSWCLTKPLRALGHVVRRVFRKK